MKTKYIIFALLLVLSFESYSQKDTLNKSFFIGIGFPSITRNIVSDYFFSDYDEPSFIDEAYGVGRDTKINVNIMLKRNIKRNTFRLGFNFAYNDDYPYKKYYEFFINLGYERQMFKGKHKLLYGMDLCYWQKHKLSEDNFASTYKFIDDLYYGAGPFIGYSYEPFNKLLIQTEVGFFWGPAHKYRLLNYGGDTKENRINIHRLFSLNIYYKISDLFNNK